MNDKDWEIQTKGDMIDLFKDNIFHLGQLHNFENKIIDKKDNRILIIIDECQIATTENQKIDKILNSIYEKCSQFESNNDIRFLNVSATPGAVLYDMQKWGNKHKLIFLEPPEKYVGFNVFIEENRLLNSEVLSEEFLNIQILPLLKNRFKKPKYHIFRELKSNRREILENFCKDLIDVLILKIGFNINDIENFITTDFNYIAENNTVANSTNSYKIIFTTKLPPVEIIPRNLPLNDSLVIGREIIEHAYFLRHLNVDTSKLMNITT
jgi:hypothetical protein